MRVELRVEAREDLADGAIFYDRQRRGLGDRFIDGIFQELETLESQAGIHEKAFGFYRSLVKRFPFAIYYLVDGSTVDVIAVLDCRRDPEWIAHRLGRAIE